MHNKYDVCSLVLVSSSFQRQHLPTSSDNRAPSNPFGDDTLCLVVRPARQTNLDPRIAHGGIFNVALGKHTHTFD